MMKQIPLGKTGLMVPNVSWGCMRMNDLSVNEASNMIQKALDLGINFFDHADIYGGGKSEEIFAKAIDMKPSIREKITIQTKAGIRKGYYDFSRKHILEAVDGSLKRLQTDYIDVLLLHRPDALMDPQEVAEAFDELEQSGKVRHFGVSNHNPLQIELLKKYVKQDLVANQLQFSVMHTGMIDTGINVNTKHPNSLDHDASTLDYCRLNDITIQPWSPVHAKDGVFLNNPQYKDLNDKLTEIGKKYDLDNEAAAIAWILRHPANMQVILGTMNPDRLDNYAKASEAELSRQDWYEIYRTAGNPIP